MTLAMAVMMVARTSACAADGLPGFHAGTAFGEQVMEERRPDGVRTVVNAPGDFNAARPTLLVFYATPNGSTIEQTLGAAPKPGHNTPFDWRYDIQHIAAQTRRLRELDRRENIVLACVEASGLSWPAWRRAHGKEDSAARIRAMVDEVRRRIPGRPTRVALTGHSGGGSFLFGFLDSGPAIPDYIERVMFLDANYSFAAEQGHGQKLAAWLAAGAKRRLVVIAYDDRNVTYEGKPVNGPDGGTWRASQRMLDALRSCSPPVRFTHSQIGPFEHYESAQAAFFLHRNPDNRILHTALVGDMNGFLVGMALGTPEEGGAGALGGPRAYTRWIEGGRESASAPDGWLNDVIPPRPADAVGGRAFMERVADLPQDAREAAIEREIAAGNVPEFLRRFRTVYVSAIDAQGAKHFASYEVAPDYLAVGSDADFMRVPMTPMLAQRLAERFGCVLPTAKMVDDVWQRAEIKLEPRPLTVDRTAARTFAQHNAIIEEQRAGRPLGMLVAGIKKDVVVTNRLREQPGRVAIYGWHLPDGSPIQPLTTVHKDTYVDYSHGIRLVRKRMVVDGRTREVPDVLRDPLLCGLLSDEGPVESGKY